MSENNTEKQLATLLEAQKKHNEEIANIGKNHKETVQELKAKSEELKKALDGEKEAKQKQQEHLDKLDVKLQEIGKQKNKADRAKSFKSVFEEIVCNDSTQKQLKELHSGGSMSMKLDEKSMANLSAANMIMKADMTSSNNYTNLVEVPDFRPAIEHDPLSNTLAIRSLLPTATTSNASVRINRETSVTNATARKAQGAKYEQSEYDVERFTYNVETIGARVDFAREMLEDTEGLASYLSTQLADGYRVKEDQQLLYGTGTNELEGIKGNAVAYVDTLNDANVQRWDVFTAAIKQVENAKYRATGILTSTNQFYQTILTKDGDNNYIYPMYVINSGNPNIAGVPLLRSTAVTDDDAFIGDWSRFSTIFDRRGLSVSFSEENGTNFEEDNITAKASARLTHAIQRPNAMVYMDVSNALATGSSA